MSDIRVLTGDIFESEAQTLTNTVNTVGVMGKGIALGFKKRFPEMYDDYVRRCEQGEVQLGRPYLYTPLVPPWILNFPTKQHWRSATKLSDLQAGLDHLASHYREWGIESLAVPPLGCGEGRLEWRVVGPTLYRAITRLDIPVELYAPFDTPHEELTPEFLATEHDTRSAPLRLDTAAIALAAVVGRIVSERHHYPVGRTVFQKITYFATQAGLPTGLEYERGPYGPFAEGVKRLAARLVNNGVLVEAKRGRMFHLRPGPTLRDAERAYEDELAKWEAVIERVADLFLRLPRTRDAEVAASAHYVAEQLHARSRAKGTPPPTAEDVVDEVERWKARREPRLSHAEVFRAVRTLDFLGWIEAAPADVDELAVV